MVTPCDKQAANAAATTQQSIKIHVTKLSELKHLYILSSSSEERKLMK